MKWLNCLSAGLVLALACLAGSGCQTHTTKQALSNGYEVVTHPHHTLIDDPEPPRIAFQHRAADGTLTPIWTSLYSPDTIIQGHLAIFIAEKADAAHETHPRLFAVRAPELPVDLTDEVLWRWCKANGKKFEKALPVFSEITAAETADGLQVNLRFLPLDTYGKARDDWPDSGSLPLTWTQVDNLIHLVKTKGAVQKDLRWHDQFIGEKF
jgi:hypothetical protein